MLRYGHMASRGSIAVAMYLTGSYKTSVLRLIVGKRPFMQGIGRCVKRGALGTCASHAISPGLGIALVSMRPFITSTSALSIRGSRPILDARLKNLVRGTLLLSWTSVS